MMTYAHTWVPCSGITVNLTYCSFSWTQATRPSEANEAVSSRSVSVISYRRRLNRVLVNVVIF